MRNRERETLLPLVLEVLRDAGAHPRDIARVVVGEGPGAFTSLRIAAATAKGLLHGTQTPLVVVSSLVWSAASAVGGADRVVAVADALRGERFAQPASRTPAGWVALAPVQLVPLASLDAWAAQWQASIVEGVRAAALPAVSPTEHRAVTLAAWEPAYGRLAEAQVKWEAAAGHALPAPHASVQLESGAP